ncbi:penicillin-binding protein activator [Acinetobacter entericus]|uniref:Penicillin-binding protein activator n=1 Tax=Acinetobacter entericus TaxID=2989714 RepID=A0ABT3NEY2_9GAMM|nr:penicillin-binding protein activator [Acinetobacter entericus]MCW8037844.1 penicillin-binding protein activator [Acinetobacter entericus]
MFKNKRNNKKNLLVLALMGGMTYAQAEVLVILPESGPMARAASSIKLGFQSAYAASGHSEPLKFVNSDQKHIAKVLKKNITAKTKLIVGPLARAEVDALMKARLKIRVLTLNEGAVQAGNITQFSLAKKDDAQALQKILAEDRMQELLVLRQPGAETEHELFLMSLVTQAGLQMQVVHAPPKKLKRHQALLLLGNNEWMNGQQKLPKKQIYTVSNAIEEDQPIPKGMKFCDTPALYRGQWAELYSAYQQHPVTMPYQRMLAFGGDAWSIAQLYLQNPKLKEAVFEGRTGLIQINGNHIQRTPHCYHNTGKGVTVI